MACIGGQRLTRLDKIVVIKQNHFIKDSCSYWWSRSNRYASLCWIFGQVRSSYWLFWQKILYWVPSRPYLGFVKMTKWWGKFFIKSDFTSNQDCYVDRFSDLTTHGTAINGHECRKSSWEAFTQQKSCVSLDKCKIVDNKVIAK